MLWKLCVLFFKNKLYFSLLILRLFYVFIAGVSCVLVAKRSVSHWKWVLILVTVLMVPVNHENHDLTILPAFLHSVVLFAFWQFGQRVVQDLSNSWPFVVAGLALAMVLSLIYIVLMRWFAGVMVWLSLLGTIALLAYCKYRAIIWQLSAASSCWHICVNIAHLANCPQAMESGYSYKLGHFQSG